MHISSGVAIPRALPSWGESNRAGGKAHSAGECSGSRGEPGTIKLTWSDFREVQLGFGDPVLQMVPLKEDDDLINQLLEHNPRFEEYLRSCMRTRTMSAETALKRLK
jgi:hypothetical protein